jgi:hypothetical protein
MVGLIRNTNVPREEEWISLLLEFLFVHAFFDIINPGSKVSEVCIIGRIRHQDMFSASN